MRKALSVVVGLLLAAMFAAQPREVRVSAVLDAVDECAILDVSGMGTATIQVQGSFVGIRWGAGHADGVGGELAGLARVDDAGRRALDRRDSRRRERAGVSDELHQRRDHRDDDGDPVRGR